MLKLLVVVGLALGATGCYARVHTAEPVVEAYEAALLRPVRRLLRRGRRALLRRRRNGPLRPGGAPAPLRRPLPPPPPCVRSLARPARARRRSPPPARAQGAPASGPAAQASPLTPAGPRPARTRVIGRVASLWRARGGAGGAFLLEAWSAFPYSLWVALSDA